MIKDSARAKNSQPFSEERAIPKVNSKNGERREYFKLLFLPIPPPAHPLGPVSERAALTIKINGNVACWRGRASAITITAIPGFIRACVFGLSASKSPQREVLMKIEYAVRKDSSHYFAFSLSCERKNPDTQKVVAPPTTLTPSKPSLDKKNAATCPDKAIC